MIGPKDVLTTDRWTLTTGTGSAGPATLRYREPVLGPDQTDAFSRCLRIVWGYAAEGSHALPDDQTTTLLEEFENHLCDALERDALGVLVAVLTLDGARQWIFYTADVKACGARINDMPQKEKPYPVELDAFPDPEWRYLRDQVLAPMQAV